MIPQKCPRLYPSTRNCQTIFGPYRNYFFLSFGVALELTEDSEASSFFYRHLFLLNLFPDIGENLSFLSRKRNLFSDSFLLFSKTVVFATFHTTKCYECFPTQLTKFPISTARGVTPITSIGLRVNSNFFGVGWRKWGVESILCWKRVHIVVLGNHPCPSTEGCRDGGGVATNSDKGIFMPFTVDFKLFTGSSSPLPTPTHYYNRKSLLILARFRRNLPIFWLFNRYFHDDRNKWIILTFSPKKSRGLLQESPTITIVWRRSRISIFRRLIVLAILRVIHGLTITSFNQQHYLKPAKSPHFGTSLDQILKKGEQQ